MLVAWEEESIRASIALRVLGSSLAAVPSHISSSCIRTAERPRLHPALGRRLDLSTPIPPEHGVLKMSEIMIPRHDILTKPRLYGREVVVSRGTYPVPFSSVPVPLPSAALPIVIRDDGGLDIELFRHVVEGH